MRYSAPPGYEDEAAEAVAVWTSHSGLRAEPGGHDVDILLALLLPPVYYEGQSAQAWVQSEGGIVRHCEVRLDPAYWPAYERQWRVNILAHELGHCLGIDHSDQPGIMMLPQVYGFSEDDGQAARAVAPMPYRATVGGVSR